MAKQANVSIFHILLGNYTCSPYFAKLHCFLPPEGQRCIEFTTRTSLKDLDKSVDTFLFEYFPKRANTLNLKKPKYAPSKLLFGFCILYESLLFGAFDTSLLRGLFRPLQLLYLLLVTLTAKVLMSSFFLLMPSPSLKAEIEVKGEGCWLWFVKAVTLIHGKVIQTWRVDST